MDYTEIIFTTAIALIYPCFFVKLANKLAGYDETNCYNLLENEESEHMEKYNKCTEDKLKNDDTTQFHKHLILLAVSLIGIILSSIIQTKSTKLGIGLGSIFTLITALVLYWHKYNETSRLVVLGSSLAFVIYLSARLYKVDHVADVFAFEFGTK